MFWVYSVGVAVAYGLQGVLIVRFAQQRDPWLVTTCRNLSFLGTFFPFVLLYSGLPALQQIILGHSLLLGLGAVFGCCSMWCRNSALKIYPVGVLTAVIVTAQTLSMVIFDVVWSGRVISAANGIMGFVIVIGSITCTWFSKTKAEPCSRRVSGQAIFLGIACGLLMTAAVIPLVEVCTQADALAAGFVWEIYIGLWAGLASAIHFALDPEWRKLNRCTYREVLWIAVAGFPAVLATVWMALAAQLGPMGLVFAVEVSSVVITTALAWAFLKEPINRMQGLVVLGVVALRAGL